MKEHEIIAGMTRLRGMIAELEGQENSISKDLEMRRAQLKKLEEALRKTRKRQRPTFDVDEDEEVVVAEPPKVPKKYKPDTKTIETVTKKPRRQNGTEKPKKFEWPSLVPFFEASCGSICLWCGVSTKECACICVTCRNPRTTCQYKCPGFFVTQKHRDAFTAGLDKHNMQTFRRMRPEILNTLPNLADMIEKEIKIHHKYPRINPNFCVWCSTPFMQHTGLYNFCNACRLSPQFTKTRKEAAKQIQ